MHWLCDPVHPEVLEGEVDHVPSQTLSAKEYWSRLSPRLKEFGISRVADITGLDRIGFPVVQAVRPLAQSNAVTQGKARNLEGAAVGAVLECLEMAAGEKMERFASVPAENAAIWSQFAPGLDEGAVWPDVKTDFIACWDILRGVCTAMPRDLISTDFTQDAPAAESPILRHSIGLGAGTNFGAAMMHGMLECIEADARLQSEAAGGERRLALSSDDPTYGPVLQLIESNSIRAAVYDLPCKGGMIVVKASIMEPPGATTLPLPATGYAARPNQSAAIAAALAEAAQARLAVISGAREDITQRFYMLDIPQADLQAEWERHDNASSMMREPLPVAPSLREIAQQVGPVFAVPLHWDSELPLAITRIVAPDLIADPLRLIPT